MLEIEHLTPHFILELTRTGNMDDMTVRIERHPDLPVDACQAATVVLAGRIKEFIGSSVRVQPEEPGALPAARGKYKRVYDLREPH